MTFDFIKKIMPSKWRLKKTKYDEDFVLIQFGFTFYVAVFFT